MAETKNPDISKLVSDALANAKAAQATRDAAKKAADALKSANAAEQRIKLTAQQRVKYAE